MEYMPARQRIRSLGRQEMAHNTLEGGRVACFTEVLLLCTLGSYAPGLKNNNNNNDTKEIAKGRKNNALNTSFERSEQPAVGAAPEANTAMWFYARWLRKVVLRFKSSEVTFTSRRQGIFYLPT